MTPPVRVALKLCGAIAAMPLSIVVAHLIDAGEWVGVFCGLIFVVAVACAFLWLIDLRQALLEMDDAGWLARSVRTLIALPQAIAGFVSLCMGLTIIGWVLYNSLVERQPEYSGGFLTFGVSSGLTLFGYGLLRDAFRRRFRPGDRPPIA